MNKSDNKESKIGEGGKQDKDRDAILKRFEMLIAGNQVKLDKILTQNAEMNKSIALINTEVTGLKQSLEFMDKTVNELKTDIKSKADKDAFEKF